MKLFINLFCIATAGVLGYMAEPKLRFELTGFQLSATEKAKNMKVVLQMPDGVTRIDITSLAPEQLPQSVLLKADVKVTDAASRMAKTLQAGSQVKLVRIEAGNVVVSPGEGPFLGLVPITDTDLADQLAASPPTVSAPETPAPSVLPTPSVPPTPPTPPVPVTPAVPDPVAPSAATTVAPAPDPVPVPEEIPVAPPAGETVPTKETATPPPANELSDAVKVMQDSVKAAEIKTFTFDQVLDWTSGTDEIHDGKTYQTGLASYKAETIFGVKTIQAKALIKDGKVQRWIGANSGKLIK